MLPVGPAPSANSSESAAPVVRRSVWWLVWGAFLLGTGVLCFLFASFSAAGPDDVVVESGMVAGIILLALTVIARWLVLPLCRRSRVAFTVFLGGLVLGAAAATCATIWGGFLRAHLFLAAALAIFQFVPVFSLRSNSTP